MALIIPRSRKVFPVSANKIRQKIPPFLLIEAESRVLNTLFVAKTIEGHVKKNETVVLVGLEAPEKLLRLLTLFGMNAEAAVNDGKLFIFSAQPALSAHLSYSMDYRAFFAELMFFTKTPIDCMVMMDIDALFNLHSQYHADASIREFIQATKAVSSKLFVHYIRKPTKGHRYLEIACRSLIENYLLLQRNAQNNYYQLRLKK